MEGILWWKERTDGRQETSMEAGRKGGWEGGCSLTFEQESTVNTNLLLVLYYKTDSICEVYIYITVSCVFENLLMNNILI